MNYELLEKSFQQVQSSWKEAKPYLGIICGSGWSSIIESFDVYDSIPFEDIPGLGKPVVEGHSGVLSWGRLDKVEAFIFQGRRHYYEGAGWTPVAFPVYCCKKSGVSVLTLTNSAGGVREDLIPGDLMIIQDHINNMHTHPLVGKHHEIWGTRFPDQSFVYDIALREMLKVAGINIGLELTEGIYFASTGPSYESPAEIRAYKKMGADAVGMSTLPEAILANASGLKVAGISCITNYAAGISAQALTHQEVTDTTTCTMPIMRSLLEEFIRQLL